MSRDKFQVSLQNILEARRRLREHVRCTPLLRSFYDPELYLKAESLQITGSFKVRAAFNEISLLSEQERSRGVVTSSSGNFAQGAAYAAGRLGVSAKIVMMRSSSELKVARTRLYGGAVVFCGDNFEAREETVRKIQRSENRTPIHPYDHLAVIAGNATLGLEILEQFPDVRNVVAPISGGGLISGVAAAIKTSGSDIRIWGVQPENSNATYLSFRAGRAMAIEAPRTIADGLMVTRPGQVTFPIIQEMIHDVVTVSEESILKAVNRLVQHERLVVEPSGAVPLAAVLENKVPLAATVLVLSGGNISPAVLAQAIQ